MDWIQNYGKYHRTFCEKCEENVKGEAPVVVCDKCESDKYITMGVFDRIEVIKDKVESRSPEHRAKYVYQVPLTFIPGVGGKTILKLLDTFETEMNILHRVSKDDLEAVVGEKIANNITLAKEGKMKVQEGGGRSLWETLWVKYRFNT